MTSKFWNCENKTKIMEDCCIYQKIFIVNKYLYVFVFLNHSKILIQTQRLNSSSLMKEQQLMDQLNQYNSLIIQRVYNLQNNLAKLDCILANDKKVYDQAKHYLQELNDKHSNLREQTIQIVQHCQNPDKTQIIRLKAQEFQLVQGQLSMLQASEQFTQKQNIEQEFRVMNSQKKTKQLIKKQIRLFLSLSKKQKPQHFLFTNKTNFSKLSTTKSQKKPIKRKQTAKPSIQPKQFGLKFQKTVKLLDDFSISKEYVQKIKIDNLNKNVQHKPLNSKNRLQSKQLNIVTKFPLNKKQSYQKGNNSIKVIQHKYSALNSNYLSTKKALFQAQSAYISSALKLNKRQIIKISKSSNKLVQQSLLRLFCIKYIHKFFSQFSNKKQYFSTNLLDESNILETLKNPEYLLAQLLQLPGLIRRKNKIHQKTYKQLIKEKSFLEQKLKILGIDLQKEPLFNFGIQMFNYVQFLIVNDLARITNRALVQGNQLNSERKFRKSAIARKKGINY